MGATGGVEKERRRGTNDVQALGGACSSVRPARPSWTSHRAPDAVVAARQHRRIHSIIQHLASATYHVNAPSVEIRMPTPGLCASGPLPPHTLSSRGNVPWSAFLPMSGVFASLTVLAAILAQYHAPTLRNPFNPHIRGCQDLSNLPLPPRTPLKPSGTRRKINIGRHQFCAAQFPDKAHPHSIIIGCLPSGCLFE
jgi:hypothetical protein